MVQEGTFPRPLLITERNVGYVLEAVEAWMQERAQRLIPEPSGECTWGRGRLPARHDDGRVITLRVVPRLRGQRLARRARGFASRLPQRSYE